MKGKKSSMKEINELEREILALEKSLKFMLDEEFTNKSEDEKLLYMGKIQHDNERLMRLKIDINSAIEKAKDDDVDKLYLSEIICRDAVDFSSNNLILAPVGSGKSYLINNVLSKGIKGRILLIVSNTALKDSVYSSVNSKNYLSEREYTTSIGDSKYNRQNNIELMTYAEFGSKISVNNDFVKGVSQIFCDEIHSLPEYRNMSNDINLSHAIKFLFNKQDGIQVFYFTATSKNLESLKVKDPKIFRDVKIFDYLSHPDIKRYVVLSKYKINHLSQIRPHLRARLESFEYFGYKGLAFSRTIEGQEIIERISKEEGFKPIVLWSVNNRERPLTDEQIEARNYLLKYGEIPSQYNLLVINSSMREGWSLHDNKIKLAIMNTTNETEYIQSLGRIRNDLDVLVYRSNDESDYELDIPREYLGKALLKDDKDRLSKELELMDSNGRIVSWRGIKKRLLESNYEVIDKTKRIDGKVNRISVITKMYSEEI